MPHPIPINTIIEKQNQPNATFDIFENFTEFHNTLKDDHKKKEIKIKAKVAKKNIKYLERTADELKKIAKKTKQNAKPLKEIQLSVNIATHDLQTKANNARRFIEEGCRVRVTLSMKGRELMRRDENKKSILEFIVMLEDVAVPESAPIDEANKTVVTLKKKK